MPQDAGQHSGIIVPDHSASESALHVRDAHYKKCALIIIIIIIIIISLILYQYYLEWCVGYVCHKQSITCYNGNMYRLINCYQNNCMIQGFEISIVG